MFQTGDHVLCIKEAEGTELVKGHYTVSRVTIDGDIIFLKEIYGGWYSNRFIPSPAVFNLDGV